MLSISCYKFACYYFLIFTEYLCTHTCYFPCFAAMLYCLEDEEFFDEDFFYECGTRSSSYGTIMSLSAPQSFWTCNKFL
jgi:hypothetical protein